MNRTERKPARLILEDGTVLRGRAFGAEVESIAELVFNTSITGYQEILTDPSYRGQTVMLTQPHIGNYGVNSEDEESAHIWTSGLIVREACGRSSNFRSGGDLSDYLAQHGVPGIEEVDTRLLTRRVRSGGAMRVLITPEMDTPLEKLLERLREAPTVSDEDHVKVVSTNEIQSWTRGYESPFAPALENDSKQPIPIVAYDLGIKRNILRSLVQSGFEVTVVPADTKAEVVLE
ncbi:MAG: carbamoyl-phosphate synthase domain-containing protein, partial [Planctomycetota bacterium]